MADTWKTKKSEVPFSSGFLHASFPSPAIVVVDRARTARSGNIIVALLINGEFTLKRLYVKNSMLYLVSANPFHKAIRIVEGVEFQMWGVVTYCIHKVT